MSRCMCCGFHFEEEDGWQEFCSAECAKKFVTRHVKDRAKKDELFSGWLGEVKNARTVRFGEQAKEPQVGLYEERTIVERDADGKVVRRYKRLVNIGGDLRVRPMTELERAYTIAMRGRGSFGENYKRNHWCDNTPSEGGHSLADRCCGDPFGRFD